MALLIIYVAFPTSFTISHPLETVNLELIFTFIQPCRWAGGRYGFGLFQPDESPVQAAARFVARIKTQFVFQLPKIKGRAIGNVCL